MAQTTVTDRKASAAEVRNYAAQLRRLAEEVGVSSVRLRDHGTVVVHSDEPGYRQVVDLSRRISAVVGCYVHVITDDVPAAADARPVLVIVADRIQCRLVGLGRRSVKATAAI